MGISTLRLSGLICLVFLSVFAILGVSESTKDPILTLIVIGIVICTFYFNIKIQKVD